MVGIPLRPIVGSAGYSLSKRSQLPHVTDVACKLPHELKEEDMAQEHSGSGGGGQCGGAQISCRSQVEEDAEEMPARLRVGTIPFALGKSWPTAWFPNPGLWISG